MAVSTSDLEQYRNQANTALTSATNFSAASPNVESELRDALASKFTSYKQPIEQRSQAMADYLSSGANARANYADPESENFVFNPYQRAKLVANAQSQAYQPYASLSDYINLGMGTVSDLAKQGAGIYSTEANRQVGLANAAQQQFQNALSEYNATKSSAGNSAISALLSQYLTGGSSQMPTEAKPVYSPTQNGALSQGGEWQFQDNDWVPVGGTTGGLGEMGDLSQQLGMIALLSADTPGEIATAFNLLNPTEKSYQSKERQAKESQQQAYDRATRLVNQALELVNSGDNVSGFSLIAPLQEKGILPGQNEQRDLLNTILGQLAGITAFDEAGKALTATELGIVGGKIPTVGSSENRLNVQLNQILNDIESKRNEYLFSQVGL